MPRGQKLYDDDELFYPEPDDEDDAYWEEDDGAADVDAAAQQRCLDALKRDLGDAFTCLLYTSPSPRD